MYSALSWRKQYGNIILSTDSEGEDVLINKIGVPYTDVHLSLDALSGANSQIWCLGKILTYSQQEAPFLHVDNDFYTWCKLPNRIEHARLVAQSLEINFDVYGTLLPICCTSLDFLPEVAKNFNPNNIKAANAGVFGGSDINFFKEFADYVFELIDQNKECLKNPHFDLGLFNLIIEQYFFQTLADERKIKIEYLLPCTSQNYIELLNISGVPQLSSFVHLIGYAKKNHYACRQMEARFRYEYPNQYWVFQKNYAQHFVTTDQANLCFQDIDSYFNKNERLFDLLYTGDLNCLCNQTIQLNEWCTIKEVQNKGTSESVYAIVTTTKTGAFESIELNGMNEVLLYFQEPISINELVSCSGFGSCSISEQAEVKRKLCDFVLENILNTELLTIVN